MRSWTFPMVVLALLGGAAGPIVSAKAAPMAVPIAAVRPAAEPLVQAAHWYGRRRWHRHHGWRRHHHGRRNVHHRHFGHHHFVHHRRLRFY